MYEQYRLQCWVYMPDTILYYMQTAIVSYPLQASLSQLSPDELRKRQEFLQQQRDKLLAMKKETREKQLGAAAKSQPQRPQSARAARSAMKNGPETAGNKEDQKKMAMRKAIAEKLREEVIGKD